MKKFQVFSKLFAFLFVLSGMIYIGCNKDVNNLQDTKETPGNTELRTRVTPALENGTLKFNTRADALDYLNELSSIMEANEDGSSNSITDEYVNPTIALSQSLESGLGFSSLYSLSNKDTDGVLIDPVYPDPAMNLILNQHYEVIIGDKLYVHKHPSEYLSIDKTDVTNRQVLRTIFPNTLISTEKMHNGIKVVEGDSRVISSIKECDCHLVFEPTGTKNLQNGTTQYKIKYTCFGVQGGNAWTIKWKNPADASDYGYINGSFNFVSQNQEILLWLPTRLLNIKIEFCATLDCGAGPKQYCFNTAISTAEECCKKFHQFSLGTRIEYDTQVLGQGFFIIQ